LWNIPTLDSIEHLSQCCLGPVVSALTKLTRGDVGSGWIRSNILRNKLKIEDTFVPIFESELRDVGRNVLQRFLERCYGRKGMTPHETFDEGYASCGGPSLFTCAK